MAPHPSSLQVADTIATILLKKLKDEPLTGAEEKALSEFMRQFPENAAIVLNRTPEQWGALLVEFSATDKEKLWKKVLQRNADIPAYRRKWIIKKRFTTNAYHGHNGLLSRLLRKLRIIP